MSNTNDQSKSETGERLTDLAGYFACEEKRWKERFKTIAAKSPVRWLDRDTFYKICDARRKAAAGQPAPGSREWSYPTNLLEIRSRVSEPPLFTPPDGDFPGPVERWYGTVGEHLFTLDYHYGFENNIAIAFVVEAINSDEAERIVRSGLDQFFAINPY
jgi:hypothetical protein